MADPALAEPLRPPRARTLSNGVWWGGVMIAVIVIAGAFLMLDPLSERDSPSGLPPELADEPDLYMEQAVITQFRSDGVLKYRLAASEIRYFENQGLTRMTEPDLNLHNDTQPSWNLKSKHGYVRQRDTAAGVAEEVVFLREDVELSQQFKDGRHLDLRSATLYLYPDRQYAETDQDVMIDTDVGRTVAAGLKGDLENGLLNLVSNQTQNVHTIVLPEQFK